jgi:hypothetical protein
MCITIEYKKNMKSMIQPVNQGIIQNVKPYYHNLLLQNLLQILDGGQIVI